MYFFDTLQENLQERLGLLLAQISKFCLFSKPGKLTGEKKSIAQILSLVFNYNFTNYEKSRRYIQKFYSII